MKQKTENRKQKTIPLTEAQKTADGWLAEMALLQADLARIGAAVAHDLAIIKAAYQDRVGAAKQQFKKLEKLLLKFCVAEKNELFPGERDRLDLPHGALLHTWKEWVVKAKGLLERLEEAGEAGAVRIIKEVDYDKLENWTDERLIKVGTERKKEEVFTYELKQS